MINKIFNKILNRETITYLLFGIITTLINIAIYKFCTYININYLIANIISWIISVLFAYITNRYFVFQKKDNINLKELFSFISSRIFTGILDLIFMFISVSILCLNDFLMKIISNIIVIIINYILSKTLIFKK